MNVGALAKNLTATISIVVSVEAVSGTVFVDTATVTATTQDLNSLKQLGDAADNGQELVGTESALASGVRVAARGVRLPVNG